MKDGQFYQFEFDEKQYVGKYELESDNFFVGKQYSYTEHDHWFYSKKCCNIVESNDPYLFELGLEDLSDQGSS